MQFIYVCLLKCRHHWVVSMIPLMQWDIPFLSPLPIKCSQNLLQGIQKPSGADFEGCAGNCRGEEAEVPLHKQKSAVRVERRDWIQPIAVSGAYFQVSGYKIAPLKQRYI